MVEKPDVITIEAALFSISSSLSPSFSFFIFFMDAYIISPANAGKRGGLR